VSFHVEQGVCFGLLGPNGAGKSTTIEMMEGIMEPLQATFSFVGSPLIRPFVNAWGFSFKRLRSRIFCECMKFETLSSFYEKTLPMDEVIQLCDLKDILNQDTDTLSVARDSGAFGDRSRQ